jgi:capsular exopolysaccharide synthesis family protein
MGEIFGTHSMFGDSFGTQASQADQGLSMSGMKNPDSPAFDIAEYWRVAVKHRLIITGAFFSALVIGIVATLLMTPQYTASTTLQIDREAARVLNVAEAAPQDSMIQGEEFFQTQYGILRSRSLTERVIEDLGLGASDAFLEQMGVKPPQRNAQTAANLALRRREEVIRVIQENLGVSPVRGSRLVSVSFKSPDPQLSTRIANAFAENFIQANLDRRYESSSYARQFLEDRIEQTKQRLADAEQQLVAYAGQKQIINIREAGQQTGEAQSLASSSLAALNSALAEARAERLAKEAKWREARSVALLTLPEVLQNPAMQRLTEERVRTNAEIEQKGRIFQADYPEMVQLRARADELEGQINALASQIRASIQNEYEVALARERSVSAAVEGLKGDVLDLRSRSVQYGILQREVDTSRALYDALLKRYNEVGVTGSVAANNISIVDAAYPPTKPSSPRLLVNIVLAAFLGLGLGVLLALLMEALDETLAAPDDVESKLGIPVLGVIPLLAKGQTPRLALADIKSNFSEAYYSLRTALQFSTPEGAPRTLLTTSARPGEGKSTTAYATALNLARLGRRVLLLDGDLRNPSMHRVIGVENDAGVSNLLSGNAELTALLKPTGQQGLDFIPCGPIPPNPAELWGSDRLRKVLQEAGEVYDHIVIDGPPVLGFADSPLLASMVGGTVFVLESKATRRAQARGALRRLALGNGRILGAVLTKFDTKAVQYGGYDYAYDYSYGGENPPKSGRR